MKAYTNLEAENTSIKTSEQVKAILLEKGFSKYFNWADYQYFKSQCQNAFNKAVAIAELFILDNNDNTSDYHDYIY
ncbi:hypothetical protein ACX0HA_08980 [Flavobacterium hauense]